MIILLCTILVVGICIFSVYQKGKENNRLSDGLKFKQEYEAYNDKLLSDGETKYLTLNIAEDNPIVYKSPKEIVDILHKETAVIYFGFPSCAFARYNVEMMLEAAKEKNIKTIYYVNIYDIRDEFEANGTLYPTQTKKAVGAYTEMVDFFGDILEDYYVSSDNSFEYATGVKRISAPTVVVVDGGKVKSINAGTYNLEKNFTDAIDEEGKQFLKNKYLEMFTYLDEKENVVCSQSGC